MQTKLTLRLDEELIRFAKFYARSSGRSVSRLIADYFELLKAGQAKREEGLTPTVRSLKGSLRGSGVDEDDYRRHLEDRHL